MAIYALLIALFVPITQQENSVEFGASYAQIGPFRISIQEEGYIPYRATNFRDLGPQVGDILNAHYFPGLAFYQGGRYTNAYNEFTYLIRNHTYIDENPNQTLYMTTAFYLRGMIFQYHATGIGRLTLAKNDFEAAIKWDPKNFPAYLELGRLLSSAGQTDQAVSVLQKLLDLQPSDEKVLTEARQQLDVLSTKSQQQGKAATATERQKTSP
jgi:tetratricopeptide (TPR) repeat protein